MVRPRLKTELWVKAQIRLCDRLVIPAAVAHRGDPDAGALILRLNRSTGLCQIFRRVTTADNDLEWMPTGGADNINNADANAFLHREISRDGDLWVLEIDDFSNKYRLDGPIAHW